MTEQQPLGPTAIATGDRLPLACAVAVAVMLVVSGIAPARRVVWVAEALPVIVALIALVATHRRFRFSDAAYLQITLLVALHLVGGHFTYSNVPLTEWLRDETRLVRNPYDRVVHFAFGALLFRPIHELLFRREPRRALRAELLLVFAVLAMLGTAYELVEWWVSLVVTPTTQAAFISAQNDFWDAQKDLLADLLGAGLAVVVQAVRLAGARRAPG